MVMKPSWPWWVEVRLLQLSMLLLCCQYKCIRCKCWKKHLFHWHLEAFETGFIGKKKKKSMNKWTVVVKTTKFFKNWSRCVGLDQFVHDEHFFKMSRECVYVCVWFVHFSCSTFPHHVAAAQLSSVGRTGNRNDSFATHSTVLRPFWGPR